MTRTCVAALALTLLMSACAASGRTRASGSFARDGSSRGLTSTSSVTDDRWRTLRLGGGVSVEVPVRWHITAYRGELATVYFPLLFLSSEPLSGPCAHDAPPSACTGRNWFADDWRTPASGVLILWSHAEFPAGPALSHLAGKRTVIGGHMAKVWSGTAGRRCAAGADTEVDAYVAEDAKPFPGYRYDMTACFGPSASAADRSAVHRTLLSLRISR